MKLFILPLGQCDNDKEKVFTPGLNHGIWVKVPIWAAVITTPRLNIIIDTGMHIDHINSPNMTFGGTDLGKVIKPIMTEEDSLSHRLEEIGLTPKDFQVVINTHLHFDHAGNNYLFPQARILVQRKHFEYAINNPNVFPWRYFLLPNLHYDLIDGELELLPHIKIIRSPGHAVGMQTVIVELPNSGTMILASDAISFEEHLSNDIWTGYEDPVNAKVSGLRMKTIQEQTNGTIIFGHDPLQWESIKKSPLYYD